MCAAVQRLDGVLSADLNFASATLLVEYDPALDPRELVERTVRGTGHGIAALDESGEVQHAPERPWIERNMAEVATVGSGTFTLLGAVLGWLGAPEVVSLAAYGVAIVFGGLLVWRRALVSLQARMLDMNVLMSVAVAGAVVLGEWGEAATVFFLFALGGLLESRSLARTRSSIRDLMDLAPQLARVSRGGVLEEVPVAAVRLGETLVVRPGERVPLDGAVLSGSSAIDESPITGESVPAEKSAGDRVFAGTLNTTGLLEVEVGALAADSTLARIVYLVEEAQASRAPSQTFVDRFSRIYTPVVIVLAAVIAVVPPLLAALLGVDWGATSEWVQRALVMLVISCPCALVISTPVSIVSGITRASRDGVLVKGGAFLEAAATVDAVAFDKTGTLTIGRPEVAAVVGLAVDEAEVLSVAGVLEGHSNHPIARAVARAAGANGREAPRATPAQVEGYEERPGVGVAGVIGGVRWELCSPACAQAQGALDERLAGAVESEESRGHTALVLLREGVGAGVIGVADRMRPEAPATVAALRGDGIEHLVMLTGDNERVAEGIAAEAGLTGFLARLLPAAKTEAIHVLKQRYRAVAMVGDGVNDAPALAAADIGIAMGAAGSDTALETADVALMRDDLSALPGFFALGRRVARTIRVNVGFSIGIKAVFLALALAGKATLWMAVFADTGVSLLVILNGMRLLRRAR